MGGAPRRAARGEDTVWSVPPVDGLNADDLTFGPGGARVEYRGEMAPAGRLDVSAATSTRLILPAVPASSTPGSDSELVIDAVAGRATLDGVQVLAWTGPVHSWDLGEQRAASWQSAVSFVGSDADEHLWLTSGGYRDVRLGGGDDSVAGGSRAWYRVRSLDGGPGRDRIYFRRGCRHLTVRVATRMTCDEGTIPFTGFDDVSVSNMAKNGVLVVVGTDADDHVSAYGAKATFHGRGGSDRAFLGGRTVRVNGGPGADTLGARGVNVVLRGQGGADRLRLEHDQTLRPYPASLFRRVALGGPGADELRGATDAHGDRLVGGPGRDHADGRGGARDYCDAEVTRRCERD